MGQVAAPTPLYSIYQQDWHLSSLMMTAVFAVYVVGLLGAMTTLGSLPDSIGRRPVIIGAILIGAVALVVFAVATSVTELLIGRVLQGIASGTATSALGASLLDLEPERLKAVAATLNGAIVSGGMAIGVLVSGALVQYVFAPTRTVYVLFLALTVAALTLLPFLPDDHPRKPVRLASLLPRFSVPREIRGLFTAVVPAMMASWVLGGMYLALGPTIAVGTLGIHNRLAAAAAPAVLLAAACTVGSLPVAGRWPQRTILVGTVLLIAGPALSVAALARPTVWAFYVSSVVAGAGLGAAYQSGLRLLLLEAPPGVRASVLACCFTLTYCCFGLPSLIAGYLEPHIGLHAVTTGFAAFTVLLAIVALVLQLRMLRRLGPPVSKTTA
jgi:MFS family permease